MGRIRGRSIRKYTVDVLKKYKDRFSDNFDANKQILNSLIQADKTTRNKIAGYITRLAKDKKIEAFVIEHAG